ncbi:MAG: hypothetical protein QOI11_3073 [Candidatus Eremiobacteraeota bacterium]|nr:hypothetical protein [Candidatus Eremiobacteraeota bacterium]
MSFAHFAAVLAHRAAVQPDFEGYVFLDELGNPVDRWSYARLQRAASTLAGRLQERTRPGDRAVIVHQPGPGFIVAFLACAWAGLTAVPVYPPAARNADALATFVRIVENCDAAVLLSDAITAQKLREPSETEPALRARTWLKVELDDGAPGAPPRARAEVPALLQYTSGTTGMPKGVVVSHRNLLHNSAQIARRFGHTHDSRGVIWLPPFHDMGLIGGILQPLYAGFQVVLMTPTAFLKRPLTWLRAVSRFRATTSGGPNFAYRLVTQRASEADLAELDLSSWSVAFNGAEPVDHHVLQQFSAKFARSGFKRSAWFVCYGLAESTLMVTGPPQSTFPTLRTTPEDTAPGDGMRDEFRHAVSCGSPADGIEVALVRRDGTRTRSEREVGEIWIRGESVAGGYWNRPHESAATFGNTLEGEGPFLCTGDLGFFEGGELFVCGRTSTLIIVRGKNFQAHDLELAASSADPAFVLEGAAAFLAEGDGEPRLIIVQEVQRTAARALDAARAREAVARAIGEQFGIAVSEVAFVRQRAIPRTSSGKLRRGACKALYLAGSLPGLTDDPAPDTVAAAG